MKKRCLSMLMAVVLCLTLCTGALAASDEPELPTEKVWYGYGHPEEAPVPLHELEEEDITIDGVSIDLPMDEDYVYITLLDLAAAKLLRDNADKLLELELSLDALYIKEGLILVKEDGLTADEIAALEAKVAELTNAVQVAVSVGDTFTLGNGEEAVFHVEIGGFTMAPVRKAAAPASEPVEEPAEEPAEEPEPEPETTPEPEQTPEPIVTPTPIPEPETFTVAAGKVFQAPSMSPYAEVTDRPAVTTLYITYGYTAYNKLNLLPDVYGTYNISAEQNFGKALNESYIYLVKSEDDANSYYYSTDGITYTQLEDCGEDEEKSTNLVKIFDRISTDATTDSRNVEEVETALSTTIYISTDADGNDVIKTIKYEDVTPKYYYKDADGNYVLDPAKKVPSVGDPDSLPSAEDYVQKPVSSNNSYTEFVPKDPIEIDTAEDGTVTAKVNNGIKIPGTVSGDSNADAASLLTADIPAEETTPAETTPAESTPAESTPAETTPAETAPAESAPAETTPAETAPAETTPAETTPAETTPAETAPAAETTAE